MAQIQPITKVFQPDEILEAAEMNMLVTKINELIQRGDGRLSSLSDVVLQNLQTGETLTWDGEQWTNARQIPLGQLGQVLYYDGDGWVALDASDLNVGQLDGHDADTFMGALEADYIQATQPQGALGKRWIDTANDKFYVYSVIGGGMWTELTRETAILRLPNILAYNHTTEAWYGKTSLGWNVIAGGGTGSVNAIRVGTTGSPILPDAQGLVTLPAYYQHGDLFVKPGGGAVNGFEIAPEAFGGIIYAVSEDGDYAELVLNAATGKMLFNGDEVVLASGLIPIEDCIKSLQSQIDSVATKDSFDNLTASSLFADVLTAGVLHIDSGYIAGDAIATQSWVQGKRYVAKINGRYPDAEGYISADGYFTDRYSSPTQDVYRLVIFGDGIELPFVNYTSSHSANDWGLWSKADVAQLDSAMTEIFSSLSGKADASDLEDYLPLTGGTMSGNLSFAEGKGVIIKGSQGQQIGRLYAPDNTQIDLQFNNGSIVHTLSLYNDEERAAIDGYVIWHQGNFDPSNIESCIKSLQSQIDSVSARDSFDELTATSLFADVLTAGSLHVNAGYIAGNTIATQSWIDDKGYLTQHQSITPAFRDDYGPYHNQYVLELAGAYTNFCLLPFVNIANYDGTNWGMMSKDDVTSLRNTISSMGTAINSKADASDLVNIEDCIKSLQSQIDSVASRDGYDELTASSLFADNVIAGNILSVGNRELRGYNSEEKNIAVRCTWMNNDPTSSTPGELGDIAINDGYVGICIGYWYSGYVWIRLDT